jgi:uroporphyrinogen III methyltransferase/synthase
MTADGIRALKNAEVVVYDKLLGEGVMDLIPSDAERINAGKQASNHLIPQDEINAVLVQKAKEGKRVVRLKGGDSYLFGRGGEEVEALYSEGIPFKVISGVTSSIAAPAYAGIPVTHRDCASSVHIITGHNKKGTPLSINFKACVEIGGTLVFLMGVKNLPVIVEGLVKAGMSEDMPCAVVQNGATSAQKKVVSTLRGIVSDAEANNIQSPAVIVVGKVCAYSDKLDWYSSLPLKGKKIIVTRPYDRAEELVLKLRDLGASVDVLPCISTVSYTELNISGDIAKSDVIAFTSPEGVRTAVNLLYAEKRDVRTFGGKSVAAVGKRTAEELLRYGIVADIVPQKHSGASLAKEIIAVKPKEVLILRAENGAKELTEALTSYGISHIDRAVYKTEIHPVVTDTRADYVVFASPSEVKGFAENKGAYIGVCIGAKTAQEAKRLNIQHIVAKTASDDGIVDAIVEDCGK